MAARELLKERHRVTVFEQSDRCGGVWVYTDEKEQEDLTGALSLALLTRFGVPIIPRALIASLLCPCLHNILSP